MFERRSDVETYRMRMTLSADGAAGDIPDLGQVGMAVASAPAGQRT